MTPIEPPPSYPGLQNRPVPSNNAPPAYAPSYNNPPAYSSPSYNTHNYRPSYNSGGGSTYTQQNSYGIHSSHPNSQGLPGNTYISNNYYGNQRSGGSGFLTSALFYGAGTHSGYGWGRSSHYGYRSHGHNNRRWDESDDRRWRATTQGPYFENKVPGEDKILPASAVIGEFKCFFPEIMIISDKLLQFYLLRRCNCIWSSLTSPTQCPVK